MTNQNHDMSIGNSEDNLPLTESTAKITPLCDADAQALDALLAALHSEAHGHYPAPGHDQPGPMPPGGAERTAKVRSLLALLKSYDGSLDRDQSTIGANTQTYAANGPETAGIDHPDHDDQHEALIKATLSRVHNERQRQRFAQQVEQLTEVRPTLGVSWRQVLSAAAVFVIGISLLMPVLKKNQADARRTACSANLQAAGTGFTGFALDHDGQMPRYDQLDNDRGWWRVGGKHEQGKPPSSNSANLYMLVRQGYITPEMLNCPSNKHAPPKSKLTPAAYDFPNYQAISYSYQNQFRPKPIRLNQARAMALLADKNPLFEIHVDKFDRRQGVANTAPSQAHGRRGQNVLIADSSVIWTVRPMVSNPSRGQTDNLWTLAGIENYTGHESPKNHHDNFLVP